MNKSVIVYGPQGCGKTTHAPAMAKHFGLSAVVEIDQLSRSKIKPTNHLYLTLDRPSWADADDRRIIPFAEAMRQAGIRAPQEAVRA
jgi:replication-associated recombination protein RarA